MGLPANNSLDNITYLISQINKLHNKFLAYKTEEIPAIETDLMLSYTRQLYDKILSINTQNTSEDSMMSMPETHGAISLSAIDNDNTNQLEIPKTITDLENINESTETETHSDVTKNIDAELINQKTDKDDKSKKTINEKLHANKHSINESLSKQKVQDSLLDKIQHSQITNLKKAIGLNKKISFLNSLFNGNLNEYDQVIEQLDNFKDFSEAKNFIDSQLTIKYNWKNSEKEIKVNEFIELVERRYIS